jgi:hypothetical protein
VNKRNAEYVRKSTERQIYKSSEKKEKKTRRKQENSLLQGRINSWSYQKPNMGDIEGAQAAQEAQISKAQVSEDYDDSDATKSSSIAVGQEHLFHVTPPHDSYEGYHRYDPHATWTEKEERRVVWKTDLMFLTWICVMVSR